MSKAWGPVILEVIPAIAFFTNNDDFLDGKTLEQDPIYSVQGPLIYEFSLAVWPRSTRPTTRATRSQYPGGGGTGM